MSNRSRCLTITLIGALSAATPAFAHAHLLSATPAVDSKGPAPTALVLHFSEALEKKFSKVSIVTAAGKDVALNVAFDPKDVKAMTATPSAPLAAGTYKVNWTAVTPDTHKLTGSYNFTVQ